MHNANRILKILNRKNMKESRILVLAAKYTNFVYNNNSMLYYEQVYSTFIAI